MQINKIEEAEKLISAQELKAPKGGYRKCIYYPDAVCNTQKMQFKICEKCPRCLALIETNVMKSLFQHIKALAISLLSHMGVSK
ncbi:MAG: hypothetical protein QME05_05665 [Candidatus Margulisbacteria bacterium]|nr:hypothetical protein [Candidatus Margulisiibacteriota bacterium]